MVRQKATPINVCHRPDGLEVRSVACWGLQFVCHRPDGLEEAS